jgi:hypothetical protein
VSIYGDHVYQINEVLGLELEGIASTMGCQPIASVVGIFHSKL